MNRLFGLYLYLQVLGLFSNAWNDFVIKMRPLIRQAVYFVVERFVEAVLDGAEYEKLFIAIVSGFIMEVNRVITVSAGVLWFMVLGMSLMHRLLVILGLCFRARITFLFR